MKIKCIKYKPYHKGHLLGFADIFVPKWGVEIYGLTLYEKDGRKWVNFPSRSYEKDGEKKNAPYFRFPESEHYTLFCSQVREAIGEKIQDQQGEKNHDNAINSSFRF
jgi:hypothetical protein